VQLTGGLGTLQSTVLALVLPPVPKLKPTPPLLPAPPGLPPPPTLGVDPVLPGGAGVLPLLAEQAANAIGTQARLKTR
jgi:hypothetical protein